MHETPQRDRRVAATIFEPGLHAEIIFSWEHLPHAAMVADRRGSHSGQLLDTLQAAERVDDLIEGPEWGERLQRKRHSQKSFAENFPLSIPSTFER